MLRLALILNVMLFLFLALAGQQSPVYAAPDNTNTLYVSDRLQVGVRRGPSSEYATIETIYTGATVTVLGESADKLWVRIATPSGRDGWVLRRYLIDTPPAALLLQDISSEGSADLNSMLETLRTENQQNKLKLAESEGKRKAAESRLQRLSEDCSSSISLRDNLDQAQQKLAEQHAQLETLRAENESLSFTSNMRWFLAGGCVLMVGWFIGWLFGRRNKRSGYSSKLRY